MLKMCFYSLETRDCLLWAVEERHETKTAFLNHSELADGRFWKRKHVTSVLLFDCKLTDTCYASFDLMMDFKDSVYFIQF